MFIGDSVYVIRVCNCFFLGIRCVISLCFVFVVLDNFAILFIYDVFRV